MGERRAGSETEGMERCGVDGQSGESGGAGNAGEREVEEEEGGPGILAG